MLSLVYSWTWEWLGFIQSIFPCVDKTSRVQTTFASVYSGSLPQHKSDCLGHSWEHTYKLTGQIRHHVYNYTLIISTYIAYFHDNHTEHILNILSSSLSTMIHIILIKGINNRRHICGQILRLFPEQLIFWNLPGKHWKFNFSLFQCEFCTPERILIWKNSCIGFNWDS